MRWFTLLLLALLAIPAGAESIPEEMLNRLPTQIAGLKRDEPRGYGATGLGNSVTFRRNDLVATVYVYDLDKKGIGESLDDPVLKEAFEGARQDIQTMAKRGRIRELVEQDAGTAEIADDCKSLRARIQFTITMDDGLEQRLQSEIHVFGVRGQIVKIRASGNIKNAAGDTVVLKEFVPNLMKELRKPVALEKPAKKTKER